MVLYIVLSHAAFSLALAFLCFALFLDKVPTPTIHYPTFVPCRLALRSALHSASPTQSRMLSSRPFAPNPQPPLLAARPNKQTSWLRRFLERPIFAVGSRLTFGAYLLHTPILFFVMGSGAPGPIHYSRAW